MTQGLAVAIIGRLFKACAHTVPECRSYGLARAFIGWVIHPRGQSLRVVASHLYEYMKLSQSCLVLRL